MRVSVDNSVCQGHGLCYSLAPKVFDCADDGYAVIRVSEVTASEEANVRRAANACPERAIHIDTAETASGTADLVAE